METLHVLPPVMTSDNAFYDVTNSIYPHATPPTSFWHQPPSRPLDDGHHPAINTSSPMEPPTYNPSTVVYNDFDNGKATVDRVRSLSGPNGAGVVGTGTSSRLSVRHANFHHHDSPSHHARVSKADDNQNNDWTAIQEEDDKDDVIDDKAKDDRSKGEDSTSAKESQVTSTLKWLSENYELSDGVCLPRCVLYVHYLDFCKRQAFKPAGAATFGKLIRQRFKNITTRRLGTRGQSNKTSRSLGEIPWNVFVRHIIGNQFDSGYHYYGIGIKESSIYYQSVYTGKGLTRFSGIKIKTEGTSRKYSLGSKTGTLLPDFPNAHNLILPSHVAVDKMDTFIMMYRTHSQRILDNVISANFEEIQNLLIHFWQGYPQHLLDILHLPVSIDVVALCDSILYKVLIDVMIPSTIQDLPESLSTDVRLFLRSLPRWIDNSLDDFVPEAVRNIKSRVLHNFLRAMKRQLAFVKMGQTARSHLTNAEVTTQALADLDIIDLDQMCLRTGFALNDKTQGCCEKAVGKLKSLFRKQSPVENFTEWLDNLIDKNVLQDENAPTKFRQRASRFLLHWTMFGALIMKDLTLNNAKSFSFLHLIKMCLDEYVFLVMETQTDKHQDVVLQTNLQTHMKNAEEIKTNAKVRNQAHRGQNSPKCRKRKLEENETTRGDVSGENEATLCQSFQPPPLSSSETLAGTVFSQPLPSTSNPRDSNPKEALPDICCTTAAAIAQANEVLRPSTITPHNLPISPIKHYPAFERPAYLPSFGLNSYSDYIGHSNSFSSPRQAQPFPDHHVSAQTFQPMTFNPTSPAAPPSYWTADGRGHAPSLTDAYTQLTYNPYHQQSYHHDPYKKSSLLRASVYHQDNFVRPAASTLDSSCFSRSSFEGLARAGPAATLDGLARHNPGFDGLSRSNGSFEPSMSTMSYYARPHDTFQVQVGSSFPVGSYSNGFMDNVMAPPSGQYGKQDGLLYQEEVFTSNIAAASGLAGFGKSYLASGFR